MYDLQSTYFHVTAEESVLLCVEGRKEAHDSVEDYVVVISVG